MHEFFLKYSFFQTHKENKKKLKNYDKKPQWLFEEK